MPLQTGKVELLRGNAGFFRRGKLSFYGGIQASSDGENGGYGEIRSSIDRKEITFMEEYRPLQT